MKRIAMLFVMLFFSAVCASAQNVMMVELRFDCSATDDFGSWATVAVAMKPPQNGVWINGTSNGIVKPLPEKPQNTFLRAMKDPAVMGFTAAHAAAAIGHAWSAKQILSRYSGEYEENAIQSFPLGHHPTNLRMLAAGSGMVIGEMWLAERMKTSRHKWARSVWWLPQTVTISFHLSATHYNLKALR